MMVFGQLHVKCVAEALCPRHVFHGRRQLTHLIQSVLELTQPDQVDC